MSSIYVLEIIYLFYMLFLGVFMCVYVLSGLSIHFLNSIFLNRGTTDVQHYMYSSQVYKIII